MVTQGGEVAFVSRMIAESLQLRDAVQWYSSMFGKATSVTAIVEKLVEAGNTNWAVTEFVQGNKTRRWAVAWSWEDLRPSMVSHDVYHYSYEKTAMNIPLCVFLKIYRGFTYTNISLESCKRRIRLP